MSLLNLRVSDRLKKQLVARSKGQHRNPSEQARRYLEIALIAEDNPELPFSFIEGILEAQAQLDAGLIEDLDRS